MTPVAHTVLDTSLVPLRERFDLFRTAIGVLHDVERLQRSDESFEARLDSWLIGGMFVTAGHQGASRVSRSPARARRDGFEHITLMHVRAGRVVGRVGEELDCGPGDTILTDASRPLSVDCTDTRNIGVRLSRASLEAAGVPARDLHGTVLRGPAGRVAARHFAGLARGASAIGDADAPLVEQVTASLVRDCLRWQHGGGPPAIAPRGDRARAEHVIDAGLSAPELDVGRIAREAGLSRSALFRAFPGGVERFVAARRLDRAFTLLRDGAGGVAQVAYAVGFGDAGQFSRAFRRRFGVAPSEVRRGGILPGSAGLPGTYARWSAALPPSTAALRRSGRRDAEAENRDAQPSPA